LGVGDRIVPCELHRENLSRKKRERQKERMKEGRKEEKEKERKKGRKKQEKPTGSVAGLESRSHSVPGNTAREPHGILSQEAHHFIALDI
jgi:hypothetical protein